MVSTKKWWAPLWLFEARAGSGCRADAYAYTQLLTYENQGEQQAQSCGQTCDCPKLCERCHLESSDCWLLALRRNICNKNLHSYSVYINR